MSTFLDDTFNYRYNPFNDTLTPYGIGKSGNPVENKTIPSTSPYYVYLDEIPQDDAPSSTVGISETAPGVTTFTEVDKSIEPTAGQFRIQYDLKGEGIIEFNSADQGKDLDIEYYGLGSTLYKIYYEQMFSRNVPEHAVDVSLDVAGSNYVLGESFNANDIIDSTANKTGKAKISKGLQGSFQPSGSSTFGALFDELLPYFKNIGDEIIIKGYYYQLVGGEGRCSFVNYARLDSANEIDMLSMRMDFKTTATYFTTFSGNGIAFGTNSSTVIDNAKLTW